MKNLQINNLEIGQTLVMLLIFMVVAITITGGAIAVIVLNSQTTTKYEQGVLAYYVAEGGVENAMLRLLRDPTYTGETLPIGTGTSVTTVSGTGPYTVASTGIVGNFRRKIQATIGYTNNILTVQSWVEVP